MDVKYLLNEYLNLSNSQQKLLYNKIRVLLFPNDNDLLIDFVPDIKETRFNEVVRRPHYRGNNTKHRFEHDIMVHELQGFASVIMLYSSRRERDLWIGLTA